MLSSIAAVSRLGPRAIASGSSWAAARSLSSVAPAEASAPDHNSTTHYRITLRRSAIGLPEKKKLVLESLGLRKRLQSVYRPKRADIAGMVLAVKELLHVENVKALTDNVDSPSLTPTEVLEGLASGAEVDVVEREDRDLIWVNEENEVVDWGARRGHKAPRGYTVVGNVSNSARNEEILQERSEKQHE